MEVKGSKCKICGCTDFVKIKSYEKDGETCEEYKCSACGTVFNTEKKNNMSETVKGSAQQSGTYTATEIFKLALKNTLNLYCAHDDVVSCGTGVYLGNGYILTNAHVITFDEGESHILAIDHMTAKMQNGKQVYALEYVSSGVNVDLAILKLVDAAPLEKASLNQKSVVTGEKVFAVGNAKGLGLSIVDGIVSNAKSVDKEGCEFFMYSAPVNHGNSGGPVFDEFGKVIGVVTFGLSNANLMNYAISIPTIMGFIKTVERKEEIKIL